jgi:hypothetical protein
VTYAREKRLLLGVAALLVALPLPFNEVLEWPALAAFLLAVVGFLRRAAYGSERWLQARALNLLGLAYLPFLAFDLGATGRIQPIRPILHLFLFGLGRSSGRCSASATSRQAWIGIFFLFLAAMATSTRPPVVLWRRSGVRRSWCSSFVSTSTCCRASGAMRRRAACRSAASSPAARGDGVVAVPSSRSCRASARRSSRRAAARRPAAGRRRGCLTR